MGNELGIILLGAAGLFTVVAACRWAYNLSKYEFENRSEGGVVGFKDYKSSIAHNFKLSLSKGLMIAGVIMSICAIGAWLNK